MRFEIRDRDIVKRPPCGFKFDVSYARASVCISCIIVVKGCQYIKCPCCEHEWILK